MKKYNYKFGKLKTTLSIIVLVLCLVVFIWNLINVITIGAKDSYEVLQYIILFIVAILLPIILVPLLVRSYYAITEDALIVNLGILKNEIKLDTITSITHDVNGKKISVYYENEKFLNIVLNDAWYENFIADLLNSNPKITYERTNDKENKE